ncbi:GNAT family N-acetyltransferase [Mangrovibacterium lignilyticum]|uniref:GNAT family N-acetyltransferase n=1 Tax=Mangrovibacterium lignilyticum TaxID=2668052 RepID=UPI0013D0191A|nr:GNAT family N-acetyltransferase [Mangrovibacterium lignilyticum]
MELKIDDYTFRPLTKETWNYFAQLFGANGACDGCWCMWWKQNTKEYDQGRGENNRKAIMQLVLDGEDLGLMAFSPKGEVCGWCAVAPRSNYKRLQNSRTLKPVDDLPVWSLTCFFINRNFRGMGIGTKLTKAALDFVRQKGGTIVEAYPTLTDEGRVPSASIFTGVPQIFERLGFEKVGEGGKRWTMRYQLK